MTISLKAHFDGQNIKLDEPAELPRDARLLVTILSPVPVDDTAESEPVSAALRAEIGAWIQVTETLAAEIEADDGLRLQTAVAEIRRHARELARQGAETSP